jgi:predicted AlkP superfamily pyrophosphatase or phosphodiesterase
MTSRRVPSARLAIVLAALAALVGASPVPRSLVIVSIDGLRPRDVIEADRYGLRIPNLRRLLREGAHAAAVTATAPAVTYPSHATLVTGVGPAHHGIAHNRPFDPLARNADGWYWYTEDVHAETLWDAASRAGLTTGAVDWPVSVGAAIDFNIAQYWRASGSELTDGAKLTRALSTSGLVAEAERAIGPYPGGYAGIRDDERRAAFVAYLLQKKRPSLQLAYFSSLDEARHGSGPESAFASETLERIDGLVGDLRAAAQRATFGRAVIAIVSDHGFTLTNRELDLNEALHAGGLLQLDSAGRVRGWRAAAWGEGGSAGIVLRDPHDDDARRRVRAILEGLGSRHDSPIDRVVEAPASLAPGGSPGEAFTVFLRLDTRLVDSRGGAVVRSAYPAGDHGHDSRRPEMDATFIIAGPGVPRGVSLGRIDMRDVAPTVAAVLGLSLPEAEGYDRLEATAVARNER